MTPEEGHTTLIGASDGPSLTSLYRFIAFRAPHPFNSFMKSNETRDEPYRSNAVATSGDSRQCQTLHCWLQRCVMFPEPMCAPPVNRPTSRETIFGLFFRHPKPKFVHSTASSLLELRAIDSASLRYARTFHSIPRFMASTARRCKRPSAISGILEIV